MIEIALLDHLGRMAERGLAQGDVRLDRLNAVGGALRVDQAHVVGEGLPVQTLRIAPRREPASGPIESQLGQPDVGQGEQSWIVLRDPEGNEFCVLAHAK